MRGPWTYWKQRPRLGIHELVRTPPRPMCWPGRQSERVGMVANGTVRSMRKRTKQMINVRRADYGRQRPRDSIASLIAAGVPVVIAALISYVWALPPARSQEGAAPTTGASTRAGKAVHKKPGNSTFVIGPEMPFRAHMRRTGVFINAHHIPKPASEVVKSIKQSKGAKPVTVIICRGDQQAALSNYRSVVDQFIMEALFMTPSDSGPKRGDLIWPDYDHRLVNYLRHIRSIAKGARIIAAIPMTTREILGRPNRPESFEEFQWMTFAVIGANYQGVLWGHVRREKWWNQRLARFERALKTHADGLGRALPVEWVRGPEGQPISAIASEKRLFVILLSPDYMKITADGKGVEVPLEAARREGDIRISLPKGRRITEGRSFWGAPLDLEANGGVITSRFGFSGGGTMLVFSLSRDNRKSDAGRPVTKPLASNRGT